MLNRARGAALAVSSLAFALGGACADGSPATDDDAARGVTIDIAALSLEGVDDVVWDVEVRNGAETPEVVWQRRVSSSRYGDSRGSASLVGPCDASPGVATNEVRVWVVGLYAEDIDEPGEFAAGDASAVPATSLAFRNPTESAPLVQDVPCTPNGDAAVRFDVALMRPASQGFFDIAVTFGDVFCSAKLDCCKVPEGGGACEDIDLLFDGGGQRARTLVLGLACATGAADGAATELFLDPIALDCDGDDGVDTTTVWIDPAAGGGGNLCAAGDLAACPAVRRGLAGSPDDYLFQVAAFRGLEALSGAAGGGRVAYWNVALGVKPGISACRLRTRATAADHADDGDAIDDGVIAAGAVYPLVTWDVDLASCGTEGLSFDDPDAPVAVAYTSTESGEATVLARRFGEGVAAACTGPGAGCGPAFPEGMVLVADACPAGWGDADNVASGQQQVNCDTVSCRLCTAPSGGAPVPPSTTFVMQACPASWTTIGTTGGGQGQAWCPDATCARCQSPATASALPVDAAFLAAACPAGFDDVGTAPLTGQAQAWCGADNCHVCKAR
ncbi:MAG: hypothetical protein H6745_07055 [Deltaproteobacteria bacterium]|nr:hypothetical protein [Deltaproteobacteria bacterium]